MNCRNCQHELTDDAAFCPWCGQAVEGAFAYRDYRYEAFLSYRHLPDSQRVAKRLQHSLEGMKVPRSMQLRKGRARLGKLFRDEDELPTSSSLNGQIDEALKHSPWLIVVCTPDTPDSKWVNREVELFASYHGRDHILVALADGDPAVSFPLLLLSRTEVDAFGSIREVQDEPIAADFRKASHKRFSAERLRIAAALIGCGYDELRQRQRARKARLIATVTSLAALASSAFGGFSLYQQRQIEANYRLAQANESEALAIESAELLAAGNRMEAIQVAMAALPQSSELQDRPLVPAAQYALERALQVYPQETYWRSCYAVNDVKGTYALSAYGQQAFERTDGTVLVSKVKNGREVGTYDVRDALDISTTDSIKLAFVPKNQLLCAGGEHLALFGTKSGKLKWRTTIDQLSPESDVRLSHKGSIVACGVSRGSLLVHEEGDIVEVKLIDTRDGATVQTFKLDIPAGVQADDTHDYTVKLAFSPDDRSLLVANSGTFWIIDLTTGTHTTRRLAHNTIHDLDHQGDRVVLVTSGQSGFANTTSFSVQANNPSVKSDVIFVEAFSPLGVPLWEAGELAQTSFDMHGLDRKSQSCVIGAWTDSASDMTQVLAAIGNTVLFLDGATGDVIRVLTLDAPLRASQLQGMLHLVDANGNLISNNPRNTTIMESLRASVGESTEATFAAADKRLYVATYDESSSRYHLYRLVRRSVGARGSKLRRSLSPFSWWAWSRQESAVQLAAYGPTMIASVDPDSFKPRWSIPSESLGTFDSLAVSCGKSTLYAYESNGATDAIYALAAEDGTLSDTIKLPDQRYGTLWQVREVAVGERPALALCDFGSVGIIDLETHEELERFETLATRGISDFALCNDTMLVTVGGFASTNESGQVLLFSRADGKTITAPLNGVTTQVSDYPAMQVAVSPDTGRVVVNCWDGLLRCFDSSSGAVLWEGENSFSTLTMVAFAPDGEHLFAQDASGICLLLSADDGRVITTSSTSLPPIWSYQYLGDDTNRLAVLYQYKGYANDRGIALVQLDEDAFGPICNCFGGIWFAPDGQSVLGYDTSYKEYRTYHCYDLDELLELARKTTKGHELTEAQRHLYRIVDNSPSTW